MDTLINAVLVAGAVATAVCVLGVVLDVHAMWTVRRRANRQIDSILRSKGLLQDSTGRRWVSRTDGKIERQG